MKYIFIYIKTRPYIGLIVLLILNLIGLVTSVVLSDIAFSQNKQIIELQEIIRDLEKKLEIKLNEKPENIEELSSTFFDKHPVVTVVIIATIVGICGIILYAAIGGFNTEEFDPVIIEEKHSPIYDMLDKLKNEVPLTRIVTPEIRDKLEELQKEILQPNPLSQQQAENYKWLVHEQLIPLFDNVWKFMEAQRKSTNSIIDILSRTNMNGGTEKGDVFSVIQKIIIEQNDKIDAIRFSTGRIPITHSDLTEIIGYSNITGMLHESNIFIIISGISLINSILNYCSLKNRPSPNKYLCPILGVSINNSTSTLNSNQENIPITVPPRFNNNILKLVRNDLENPNIIKTDSVFIIQPNQVAVRNVNFEVNIPINPIRDNLLINGNSGNIPKKNLAITFIENINVFDIKVIAILSIISFSISAYLLYDKLKKP